MENAVRSYATDAFRRYAAMGMPDYGKLKAGDFSAADIPGLMDIYAVEKTLSRLSVIRPLAAEAVKTVYFTDPKLPFSQRDAVMRVRYFALERNLSERTVYRLLKQARDEFARHRGLYM